MGLDMYLYKKSYVQNWDHMTPDEKHQITVKKNKKAVKPARITYITEQVGYWRKANAIHKWFVENVQGGRDECQESYVSEEQLLELKSLCEQVLADTSLAHELLPSASGFFFGSTEYGEYYFEDVKNTVKIIDEILKEKEPGQDYLPSDILYHASW